MPLMYSNIIKCFCFSKIFHLHMGHLEGTGARNSLCCVGNCGSDCRFQFEFLFQINLYLAGSLVVNKLTSLKKQMFEVDTRANKNISRHIVCA